MKFILSIFIGLVLLLSCSNDKEDLIYNLSVDKTRLFFENRTAEELTFNIISNDSWEIVFKENEWVSLDKTHGTGNAEIKVTAQPNTTEKMRSIALIIRPANEENSTIVRVEQDLPNFDILPFIKDESFKEYLINEAFKGKTVITTKDARELKIIDVFRMTNITSLEGIEFFPNLSFLDCSETSITNLDLSKNPKLEDLRCDNISITSLDLSKNSNLRDVRCKSNSLNSITICQVTLDSLSYLDIGKDNPMIKVINCN